MRWLSILCLCGLVSLAEAQVSISLPGMQVESGAAFSIPVELQNVESGQRIQAFEFSIATTGPSVTFRGGDFQGTLVDKSGWTYSCNTAINKCLGFSGSPDAVASSGTLVRLGFVAGSAGGSVTITLTNLRFNGGSPNHTPSIPATTITIGGGGSSNTRPSAPLVSMPSVVVVGGEPSDEAFQMQWQPSTDPDGDAVTYTVEFAMDQAFLSPLSSTDVGNNTSHSLSVEEAGGLVAAGLSRLEREVRTGESLSMWARVRAFDGQEFSDASAAALTLVRAEIVSNEGEVFVPTDAVEMFPNPVTNQLSMQWNLTGAREGVLRIVDTLGRVQYEASIDSLSNASSGRREIDGSSWSPGVYVYALTVRFPDGRLRIFKGSFIKVEP